MLHCTKSACVPPLDSSPASAQEWSVADNKNAPRSKKTQRIVSLRTDRDFIGINLVKIEYNFNSNRILYFPASILLSLRIFGMQNYASKSENAPGKNKMSRNGRENRLIQMEGRNGFAPTKQP
jgi:hypothetical protein